MVGTEANPLKATMRTHSLGVKFKDGSQWGLLFKSLEKANQSYRTANASLRSARDAGSFSPTVLIELTDDYGSTVLATCEEVAGFILEDLEAVGEGIIERSLIQGRTQARLNSRAQGDPILKTDAILRGDMHRINGPLRS